MANCNKVPIIGSNHIPHSRATCCNQLDQNQKITTTWIVNTDGNDKFNILNEVKMFCNQNNLKIKNESSVHNLTHLKVSGLSKDYENALNIKMHEFKKDDAIYYATMEQIQIPLKWNNNVNILGLDTDKIAHPYVQKLEKNNLIQSRALTTFNPLQLATLYNFPPNLNGSGQKIGIIQLGGGYVLSDMTTYFTYLGINTTPNITAVSVDGAVNNPADTSGANLEVILDMQVIAALVPNAAIRIYFGPNSYQGFYNVINAAINDNCSIISISWGATESQWSLSTLTAYNNLFQTASTKNITILAASGDYGSSDGKVGNNVNFPSASPYVLACGGTNLKTINNTTISTEIVWSGSGGGVSKTFARPSYQNNLPQNTLNLLNGKRGSPDICGNADPNTGYVLYSASQGGYFVVGGTSAVSPLWSGLLGRINQSLGFNVGFINPFLYSQTNIYNDILQGNNGAFSGALGWDPCTGWGSPNGVKILNALTANNNPVANFTASPLSGNTPLAVNFTDTSTGNPTAWAWNFGDNTTSTLQNPSRIYQNVGSYNVSLMVTNSSGSNTILKQNFITTTSSQTPVVAFSATPLSGVAPLNIQFTDSSTNSPTSWLWNFGNNVTSTLQNPSHTYQNAGLYNVSLTATNSSGTNTLTKQNYVNVIVNLVSAFSSNIQSGNGPTNIIFTDLSTGTPTSWLWNFGDGNTSTAQNPSHTYSNRGTYTVSLRVSNSLSSNTLTKTGYITITRNAPVTSFTGTPTFGKKTLSVKFTDTSKFNPTRWTWNFGDNTTSTLQNPTHNYAVAGTYAVKLTTSNAFGSNSLVKLRYITVTN